MSSTAQRLKEDALDALRENIVVYRARIGLSQVELADKAGVSRPVVSKMEQGVTAPSFDSLAKIANVLGCSIADLLLHERDVNVSDDEILRRAASDSSDDVDVDALLNALDEANQRPSFQARRYSTKGRKPAMADQRQRARR